MVSIIAVDYVSIEEDRSVLLALAEVLRGGVGTVASPDASIAVHFDLIFTGRLDYHVTGNSSSPKMPESLEARQRLANTLMGTVTKRDMTARIALDVELLWRLEYVWVVVCGIQRREDRISWTYLFDRADR
jgi:hypothetical protein